jgi:hypothetical protein
LKAAVPTGERWLYEIKHDGYRIQAHLVEGKPALLTSSGLNWTSRFRAIAQRLGDLPANSIIMDGEVVVPNDKGIADFSSLQAELAAGRSSRMLGQSWLPPIPPNPPDPENRYSRRGTKLPALPTRNWLPTRRAATLEYARAMPTQKPTR